VQFEFWRATTLIPLGFQNTLEIKLKDYSGMRQACRILHTDTGANIIWPCADDTTDIGAIVAESAAVTTADPTFTSVTLSSSLISSKQVIVPIQVLQDSAIDLEGYLSEAFSIRIGRAMEANLLERCLERSTTLRILADYAPGPTPEAVLRESQFAW
jgi:HK97 family phage major capsid protein